LLEFANLVSVGCLLRNGLKVLSGR
jgi:hypothetical protein